MNKNRAEKRKQMLIVLVGTGAILAGIWFGLIAAQKDALQSLAARRVNLEKQNDQMQTTLKGAQRVEAELAEGGTRLAKLETGMATGDLYSWAINTIKQFQTPYKVEIPQFSPINGPADVNMVPNFPYQQASLTISGTANYYEFGKFVAAFENEFPLTRLGNLILEPALSAATDDPEKLTFKLDVITLVKPHNS